MVSESQERMLVITDQQKLSKLQEICSRFHVACSVIGKVTDNKLMHIRRNSSVIASLPAEIVANAPLLDRPSKEPSYLKEIQQRKEPKPVKNLSKTIMDLISCPNIASKIWVYGQYDFEVGVRTVVKPGSDAAVLRLDNGKYLAAKIDGNPKQCHIDPKNGAIGCFEEACRNVVCTGAKPIGMVDHLQFGNPEDPEVFWTFLESLKGIVEFAKAFEIPCVGGKVSLYNETPHGPIKPTPIIGILGLIEKKPLQPKKIEEGDLLLIIGKTKHELGGSEYFEYVHDFIGGKCPVVDFVESKKNMSAVLHLIENGLVRSVHDCSKGGLAIAVSELAMANMIGCQVDLDKIPGEDQGKDSLMFSESHSRYLLVIDKSSLYPILAYLQDKKVQFGMIGKFEGSRILFLEDKNTVANVRVDKAKERWINSLRELVLHG